MVSVIIPAYNSETCIKRAIDSVLAQTWKGEYEIIVIDDGSTDNTAQIVKSFGNKVSYIYQQNAGVSVARNTGLAAAKGTWIAFLDADDQWLENKLALQMELLEKNPFLKWCSTNRYQSDGTKSSVVGNPAAIKQALGDKNYFENYFKAAAENKCPISTPTIIIAKDVFDQVGNFEPGRVRGQDIDLWWRMAYRYPQIGYIPEPLAMIHLDVDNTELTKRRLETKRGADFRQLIARHINLAVQQGMLEDFHPFAAKLLRNVLLTAIYHGYAQDARITVNQFNEFFPWYWRIAAYLLTIMPDVTSSFAKSAAYIVYKLKPNSNVTRRWLYAKTLRNKQKI